MTNVPRDTGVSYRRYRWMNKDWRGPAVSIKYLTVLLNGPRPKFPHDTLFSNLEGGGSNKMQPCAKLMSYPHQGPVLWIAVPPR